MWRALSHRNFRLFFGGQGISMIGTWMTRIATSWIVFRISPPSQAAILLGVVSFAGQIPTFFLAPFAGVLVDRWNRHRLLVITQTLSMLQSFGLAAAVGFHQSNTAVIVELLCLQVVQGVINAFDTPGRQAFLVEMVTDRGDLANAIALNSSLVNGARLIGPSIAGILIALVGEIWCFLIDGISYIAVIWALLAMQLSSHREKRTARPFWHEFRQGLSYAYHFLPIRYLLLQLSLVSFMGMAYTVLMPIFADMLVKNGAWVMGFLMGASGVGALVGALFLASRRTVLGLGKLIAFCTLILGVALAAFAYSRSLPLSLFFMLLTGFGMMVQMAATNTILQTVVEEDKRGRVMSLYTMAFMGMAPIGSLFAGGMAKVMGAPNAVALTGAACVVGASLFAMKLKDLREVIRPIYQKLGILPEVAEGLGAAASDMTAPHT